MGKYSYNAAVGQKAAERKVHAEGVFARLVTSVEKYVPEDQDELKVIVKSQALKDLDDPESVVPGSDMADFFTLPVNNPDVAGHNFLDGEWADMQAKQWAEFCAAIFDDVSQKPLRATKDPVSDKLTGPYYYDGEEIDSEDYAQYLQESVDQAGAKAIEVLEALDEESDLGINGLGVVGAGYFAPIKHKTKDGIRRVNQVAYRAELPDYWELETENFILIEGPKTKSAPKNAPKKKTTKKKAKKKGR